MECHALVGTGGSVRITVGIACVPHDSKDRRAEHVQWPTVVCKT
jgi:hypothetical protein